MKTEVIKDSSWEDEMERFARLIYFGAGVVCGIFIGVIAVVARV